MDTNTLPYVDTSDNPTGCCPRFQPEGWDSQQLHFEAKPFVRAETRSLFHMPLNMGKVFGRVMGKIDAAGGMPPDNYLTLSHDPSPWRAEHLFAMDKPIEGEEMVELSGDYLTKVFEGPFQDAGKWHKAMEQLARDAGQSAKKVWFFYTTCPKCAKVYGKNYVVGLVQV